MDFDRETNQKDRGGLPKPQPLAGQVERLKKLKASAEAEAERKQREKLNASRQHLGAQKERFLLVWFVGWFRFLLVWFFVGWVRDDCCCLL